MSSFQFFYHASKKPEVCQDRCVLLASCMRLRCLYSSITHHTYKSFSIIFTPRWYAHCTKAIGGLSVITFQKLFWEHLTLLPTCPASLNKESPAASKGWSFTSAEAGVRGSVMMSRASTAFYWYISSCFKKEVSTLDIIFGRKTVLLNKQMNEDRRCVQEGF